MHRLVSLWLIASCLFLASCASTKREQLHQATPPQAKSLSQRLNEKAGYVQDSEGNWVAHGARRSSFENQPRDTAYFRKERPKTPKVGTEELVKRGWWGRSEYEAERYQVASKRSKHERRARPEGQTARDSGRPSPLTGRYPTSELARTSAREATVAEVSRPLDPRVTARQEVFQAPSIIGWEEQRRLSLEESRSLLGR